MYPYLFGHVRLQELDDRDVLEIGLGCGSLSQKIAESSARYVGLDIAAGPVEIVRHRFDSGMPGRAEQGSVLAAPFPDESFDCVITIDCLHPTCDMGRGIAECRRMLRPGGSLVAMVYLCLLVSSLDAGASPNPELSVVRDVGIPRCRHPRKRTGKVDI